MTSGVNNGGNGGWGAAWNSITQGVADTAQQVGKTMSDVAEGIGKAAHDAGTAVAEGIDHIVSETNKEMNDIGEKAKKGDLLGAYVELSEFFSPGTHAAIQLGALGIGKGDPVATNLISAGANLVYGQPVAAVKDLFDVADALGKAEVSSDAKPAPSHTPERPTRAAMRSRTRRSERSGGSERTRRSDAADPKAEAKATAKAEAKAEAKARAEQVVDAAASRAELRKIAEAMLDGGFAPSGASSADMERLIQEALDNLLKNPPPARNVGREFLAEIDKLWQKELKEAGFGGGEPCRDKPLEDRGFADILNDPTLTFEDMVAMFMAKVMDDMEDQVKAQMKKMEAMRSGGSEGSAAAADSGDFDKNYDSAKQAFAGGEAGISEAIRNSGPMLDGALNMLSMAAPFLGTAIGTAIGACGGPTVVAGAPIGALVGLGISLLCQGGKLAIQAGALDGIADMVSGLEGGDKKAESRLAVGQGPQGANGSSGVEGQSKEDKQNSFNLEMEKLKLLMQRMQQMQQALSNVLNTMHQGAMNAIRNIK